MECSLEVRPAALIRSDELHAFWGDEPTFSRFTTQATHEESLMLVQSNADLLQGSDFVGRYLLAATEHGVALQLVRSGWAYASRIEYDDTCVMRGDTSNLVCTGQPSNVLVSDGEQAVRVWTDANVRWSEERGAHGFNVLLQPLEADGGQRRGGRNLAWRRARRPGISQQRRSGPGVALEPDLTRTVSLAPDPRRRTRSRSQRPCEVLPLHVGRGLIGLGG